MTKTKTETLWLTLFFDGLDENWLMYASEKDNPEKAEQTFKLIFYREYGMKFKDEITGTYEINNIGSLTKDYRVMLKMI